MRLLTSHNRYILSLCDYGSGRLQIGPLEDFVSAHDAVRRLHGHPEKVMWLPSQGVLPARKFLNRSLIRRNIVDMLSSTYAPRLDAKRKLI